MGFNFKTIFSFFCLILLFFFFLHNDDIDWMRRNGTQLLFVNSRNARNDFSGPPIRMHTLQYNNHLLDFLVRNPWLCRSFLKIAPIIRGYALRLYRNSFSQYIYVWIIAHQKIYSNFNLMNFVVLRAPTRMALSHTQCYSVDVLYCFVIYWIIVCRQSQNV